MNDDGKPLTKKDLIEVLGDLDSGLRKYVHEALRELDEGLREYVHDTETRILKPFHLFSTANDLRLRQLEEFGATAGKRLADLEAVGRLAELELRVAEIEKKLDRRQ
jgi:hypothetical protein